MTSAGESPALQVIVLGSGGGPKEDNTTAFLVRSTATKWQRGSVLAVDAGTHLAAVARILEPYVADANVQSLPLTSGPFKGLKLPFVTADANAAHIAYFLIDTYLITHPHLDHISALIVNSAGLPGPRPKRLAALPRTIAAFKAHIFNNVIWPNMTDENNGVGLITYMRLVDGGSPHLGDGDCKGYIEICEGLGVKALSVSHGHCMENHSHRGSTAGTYPYEGSPEYETFPQRSNSQVSRVTISTESYDRRDSNQRVCVYDSSAYFIRDVATGREVLIFGDVEPDSVSLSPRNIQAWTDAAPKIASGLLAAIFIECSWSDSRPDSQLYGHLNPRYFIKELKSLASCVEAARQDDENDKKGRKRKRSNILQESEQSQPQNPRPRRSPRCLAMELDGPTAMATTATPDASPILGLRTKHKSSQPALSDGSPPGGVGEDLTTTDTNSLGPEPPLKGLKVVIIHVKESLVDAEPAGETILRQVRKYVEAEKLGCEVLLASGGMSIYL